MQWLKTGRLRLGPYMQFTLKHQYRSARRRESRYGAALDEWEQRKREGWRERSTGKSQPECEQR